LDAIGVDVIGDGGSVDGKRSIAGDIGGGDGFAKVGVGDGGGDADYAESFGAEDFTGSVIVELERSEEVAGVVGATKDNFCGAG